MPSSSKGMRTYVSFQGNCVLPKLGLSVWHRIATFKFHLIITQEELGKYLTAMLGCTSGAVGKSVT